jgi:hypothetical protein
MKIAIKPRAGDLNRIAAKLTAWQKRIFAANGEVIEFLVEEVGEDYREAVVSGMGVVSEDGGSVTLKPFLGHPGPTANFQALSDKTRSKKRKQKTWNLNIWMASGATARAVQVHSPKTSARRVEVFSGILGSTHRDELEKALRVEHGFDDPSILESWPARSLFTVLNAAIRQYRGAIARRLHAIIIEEARMVGWGR